MSSTSMTPEVQELIRTTFLENGFTVKENHTDLKPYVYQAGLELLIRVGAVELNQDKQWSLRHE